MRSEVDLHIEAAQAQDRAEELAVSQKKQHGLPKFDEGERQHTEIIHTFSILQRIAS